MKGYLDYVTRADRALSKSHPCCHCRSPIYDISTRSHQPRCRSCNTVYIGSYVKRHREFLPKQRARQRRRYREQPAIRLRSVLQVTLNRMVLACQRAEAVGLPVVSNVGAKLRQAAGWTVADFRRSFARQLAFLGLGWDDFGREWVIDHIRPICAFDPIASYEDPLFEKCWSLSNLRPLTVAEHREKSARETAMCHSEGRTLRRKTAA